MCDPYCQIRAPRFLTSYLTEISRTRHVQYCRRRAERSQSSRPRACLHCRSTKSKCDFSRPCSRCARKGVECSYGTYRDVKASGAVARSASSQQTSSGVGTAGLMTDISPRIFGDDSITPSLITHAQDAGFILPFDSQGAVAVDSTSDNTRPLICNDMFTTVSLHRDAELPSLPPTPNPAIDGINAFLLFEEGSTHNLIPSTPLASRDPDDATTDDQSLVPVPDRTIGAPPKLSSRRISRGCRRFILSTIRTYPGMMVTPDNLPPYVHRVGCGLHFDEKDELPHSTETGAFAPLKPLAACYGIAQIFASRGPNTSDFLWRTIENEHLLIRNEVC